MSNEFETLMHDKFQMSSMGELSFFLGLQIKQKSDGIFISQDKYVAEILKKFDVASIMIASTLMETNKALIKDEEAEDVNVLLYRSMIGSLMYLTASRPDIMFAVCACARFQVTPKTSHFNVVKRIFRYLKGQPKLGLWNDERRFMITTAEKLRKCLGASYSSVMQLKEEESVETAPTYTKESSDSTGQVMSIDEELAKKVFEEEQAKAMAEQEQERINFEAALKLQKQLDEREEVVAETTQAQQIDWSDPAGGYKLNYFKGMKYEVIRPIFEKVWDQIQSFTPMNSEKEKDSEKKGSKKKSIARKRACEKQKDE
ncbi:uncharacterized mitochondrial protein-like protein [Tanacetum coccineum]